ncbi:MAG: protein kinase [Deltaproteobacteria bacterium]|nr:protein kinase [Deltaproteobacteria bacterium]
MSTPLPTSIGRYQVVKKLGAGAMGEVFEVVDKDLGRHVALKLLSPEMASSSSARERFRREAVSMAQIRHPHVLQVYEYDNWNNQPFFTMELVEGGDCATYIEQSVVLAVPHLARLLYQSAQGLAAAAERGLVHRDVKPANLLLHAGAVKVSDFGIVRHVESTGGLTQYGIVMGTPEYMAPEQAMGQQVDLRADIYALGVSLYQLATCMLPFSGEAGAVLQMQVERPLPDPRDLRPDLPEAVVRLMRHMTEKDPRRRYQGYEELCADLAPLMGDPAQVSASGAPGALVYSDGALAGRKIELPEGEFVMGRQPDCHLVLDDPQCSRRHALFLRDAQGLLVRDLGSRNGVLVNGVRSSSQRLQVGDLVQVGNSGFKVIVGAPIVHEISLAPKGDARVGMLARLARRLTDPSPLNAMGALLGELVKGEPQLLPANRLVLVRWQTGQPGKVLFHESKRPEDAIAPLSAVIQRACELRQPLVLRDARTDPRFSKQAGGVATVLCAPLLKGEEVLGALYVDATDTRDLAAPETTFFEAVANLAAAAMAQG